MVENFCPVVYSQPVSFASNPVKKTGLCIISDFVIVYPMALKLFQPANPVSPFANPLKDYFKGMAPFFSHAKGCSQ